MPCERLGVFDGSTASRLREPDDGWLEGLDEAFDHLPERQREAIRLRVVEDLDYDGVAERWRPRRRPSARVSRAACAPSQAIQIPWRST